jgi:eukaryotic-like serine/threonine-protein kinase
MAGSACLSDAVLSAYHRGALIGNPWNAAAAHLRACPDCLARLDRLPAIDPILAALRRAPDEPTPPDAAYRRAVARATEEHPSAILHVGPGSTLREYRLLKPLGEGGMGVVFKAVHTRLDRVVALKVLRRGRRDSAFLARFDREIRAAGRFRHEHIVQATDAGEVNGMPFLVMEFVEGRDLSRLVRERGKLRPIDACEIVRQAALSLAHAHEAGIVHREVKPSNLMLTPAGSVKVLDLGLALLRSGDDLPPLSDSGDPSTWHNEATLTSSQQALDARHYIAPEQWKTPDAVDARADVFGLGRTLVFLLSGRAARQEDAGEIPGAPPNVLRRMIAPDPGERFPAAAGVAVALKPFARGSDLPALAANRPPRMRRRIAGWLGFGALAVFAS